MKLWYAKKSPLWVNVRNASVYIFVKAGKGSMLQQWILLKGPMHTAACIDYVSPLVSIYMGPLRVHYFKGGRY
jgi:hypothetical protein